MRTVARPIIRLAMKQFVLETHPKDQGNEGEELSLILNELVADDEQGQTFIFALVALAILTGSTLVGIGLYLGIFWGL